MIKPINKNVVIKPLDAETKTKGGIIIPDTVKDRPTLGEVVATASTFIGLGDKVYYKRWGGNEVRFEGEDYIIVEEKDVLAIKHV